VRLASGGQPERRRKTRFGGRCERQGGNGSEEGISDRRSRHPSRGAVEPVSILRSPRKLTFNGGSVLRRVTGCQRRSRERSEASAFGFQPGASGGRTPLLVAARPAEAGPARRETTDPPIAPHASTRTARCEHARRIKQGRKPRARVQVSGRKSGWQKSVGRIVTLA